MIKFKTKQTQSRFVFMHPILVMLAARMFLYCETEKQPFMITSTVSTKKQDEKLKRKSLTHRQGRAFDIRIFHWDHGFLLKFVDYFESNYGHYGAYSKKLKKRRLIVLKKDHIHVQIHSKYKLFEEYTGE